MVCVRSHRLCKYFCSSILKHYGIGFREKYYLFEEIPGNDMHFYNYILPKLNISLIILTRAYVLESVVKNGITTSLKSE